MVPFSNNSFLWRQLTGSRPFLKTWHSSSIGAVAVKLHGVFGQRLFRMAARRSPLGRIPLAMIQPRSVIEIGFYEIEVGRIYDQGVLTFVLE
jgi:hypothetical protein